MLGPRSELFYRRRRLLAAVAMIGAMIALLSDGLFWAVVSAIAAVITLLVVIWAEVLAPWLRRRKGWPKQLEGGHSRDIHKHWHIVRNKHYSVGSHRVITFRVQTGDAGIYRFQIAFFTDEVEGNAELKMRIEDTPQTRVPCRAKGHWGCYIGPQSPIQI